MYDNHSPGDIVFALKDKKSGRFATDYNFMIQGALNSNDNMMVLIFADSTLEDAEISADRHFSKWREYYDLVPVRIVEVVNDKD